MPGERTWRERGGRRNGINSQPWAHGALLTTFPGDVTMARADEVEAFAKGGSTRVQR